ncbi:MAG: cob(I)yrinic acid a,c-diamide adenosyltransferase [Kiritimatiellales bacterium]|nr:cob(I)yrinic acid a,c-diamide adenosyltransferase [Kiritimatiellales bacterium]
MDKGYVQVYTGNGKGKTTAALGLALRAAGAGLRVFIGQFTKGRTCSEHEALKRFGDLVTVRQFGEPEFIRGEASATDIEKAQAGFKQASAAVMSGGYSVVILDEINIAVYYKMVSADEVLELIDRKPEGVELILTGRNADPRIVEKADLVTEMREVKHYFSQGVVAREGIEE